MSAGEAFDDAQEAMLKALDLLDRLKTRYPIKTAIQFVTYEYYELRMSYPNLELIDVTMHPAGLPITGQIATTYRRTRYGQACLIHGGGSLDPAIACPDPMCFCRSKYEHWTPDGQYGAIAWERDGQAYWEYCNLLDGKLLEAGRPVGSLEEARLIVNGSVLSHRMDEEDQSISSIFGIEP